MYLTRLSVLTALLAISSLISGAVEQPCLSALEASIGSIIRIGSYKPIERLELTEEIKRAKALLGEAQCCDSSITTTISSANETMKGGTSLTRPRPEELMEQLSKTHRRASPTQKDQFLTAAKKLIETIESLQLRDPFDASAISAAIERYKVSR